MSPVERAKTDLARIGADIERLRAQLASLNVRRDKIQAYVELADFYASDESEAESVRAKGGVSGAAVRAAVEAIRDRAKPIHTRELLELLGKQGIQIGGKDPVANLSGFLSRSDELKNSRAYGWGLAEWGAPTDETTFVMLDGENLPTSVRVIQGPVGSLVEQDDEVPF